MKIKNAVAGMMLCLAMVSCIQDEALNVEAAIDGCSGSDIQQCLIDPNEFTVQLYVSRAADLSRININFELPAGASITPVQQLPEDETNIYNFDDSHNPREFKVTSEDGAHSATYTVKLWQTEMPFTYNFETLSSDNPYHKFTETENAPASKYIRRLELASGNAGFELTKMAKTPEDFPTVQVNGGVDGGKCVKLETKDTGSFGSMVNMYIAAGNLFIGSFEVGQALNNAKKATHFGFPFFYYPLRLEGYYKYKAGANFSSEGKIVEGKDQCDIYGVLYETDDKVQYLDGTNSLTSPNIVALARNIEELTETDEWTFFNFRFEPKNNKSIDPDKLEKGIYKLAIVFSSSVDGADFKGAVGSTLYIDKVKIIHTENPDEYPLN